MSGQRLTARQYRTLKRRVGRVRRVSRPGFVDGVRILAVGVERGVLWCVREHPSAGYRRELMASLGDDQAAELLDFGEGNGYAHIPRSHPWRAALERVTWVSIPGAYAYPVYGYEDLPVSVHGCLTYGDAYGWVGFDTAHAWDSRERWPLWAVVGETRFMARQIAQHAR